MFYSIYVCVCVQVIMEWYDALHILRSVQRLCHAVTTTERGFGIAKPTCSDEVNISDDVTLSRVIDR